MKRVAITAVFVLFTAVLCLAAEASGRYSFSVSKSRDGGSQVVVGDTVTGNFEVYDLDNKGLDRKTNEEYYPCYYYDVRAKKRYIKMVKDSVSEE